MNIRLYVHNNSTFSYFLPLPQQLTELRKDSVFACCSEYKVQAAKVASICLYLDYYMNLLVCCGFLCI